MISINILSVLQFINFLSCTTVVFLFFIYGKNKLQRFWAIFNLSVALWALFNSIAVSAVNPQTSYLFWRIMMIPTIFIGATFYQFVCTFTSEESKHLIPFSYFYCFLFTWISLTNNGHYFFTGTNLLFSESNHLGLKPLEFTLAFSLWYILVFLAHVKLYKFLTKSKNPQRKEALYLFIICLVGFAGGCSTLIPMYGLHNFYPITVALTTVYSFAASYAIFRHQILAINIVLAKGLIYTTLASSVTILYLLFVFLTDNFLRDHLSYNSFVVRIIIILFIAAISIPLKDYIQRLVDKIFLRGTPVELANENQLLRQNAVQSEKMKTIATLASSIAHEIRNPLTALKTFVEYFPKKRNDPEYIAKFESIASTEITRIENILNELLEFAKPSPLTLKVTNIQSTLEHAVNLTANQLRKGNVHVTTQFASDLPTIKADSNKLLQVFINLILNALEAMPSGGTLTINTIERNAVTKSHRDSLRSQSLKIATSPQEAPRNGNIDISFTDSGTGIPRESLNKIFEPFYSTKDTGTGLGLAIVKGIIDDHGGKIAVESVVGKCTTFTISLPTAAKTEKNQ